MVNLQMLIKVFEFENDFCELYIRYKFAYLQKKNYICNLNLFSYISIKMEDNFASRLKLFIDTNGLSPSQFADMCRIPRPTLSQVLSGRNKKISDVLLRPIHDAFPDLSLLWLMFGEGPVKVSGSYPSLGIRSASDGVHSQSQGKIDPLRGNIANENPENPGNDADVNFHSTENGLRNKENGGNYTKNQVFEADLRIVDLQHQIEQMRQNPRRVMQITIYYDDSTFETFIPKRD